MYAVEIIKICQKIQPGQDRWFGAANKAKKRQTEKLIKIYGQALRPNTSELQRRRNEAIIYYSFDKSKYPPKKTR